MLETSASSYTVLYNLYANVKTFINAYVGDLFVAVNEVNIKHNQISKQIDK